MTFIKNFSLCVFCAFAFTACYAQPKNYAYLVSHPNDLNQAVTQCQSNQPDKNYCEMVERAHQDFASLFNEWQQGPENFGKRILQLQMTNADVSQISRNNFSEPLDQKQMIAAYLAVVGLSPIE